MYPVCYIQYPSIRMTNTSLVYEAPCTLHHVTRMLHRVPCILHRAHRMPHLSVAPEQDVLGEELGRKIKEEVLAICGEVHYLVMDIHTMAYVHGDVHHRVEVGEAAQHFLRIVLTIEVPILFLWFAHDSTKASHIVYRRLSLSYMSCIDLHQWRSAERIGS